MWSKFFNFKKKIVNAFQSIIVLLKLIKNKKKSDDNLLIFFENNFIIDTIFWSNLTFIYFNVIENEFEIPM